MVRPPRCSSLGYLYNENRSQRKYPAPSSSAPLCHRLHPATLDDETEYLTDQNTALPWVEECQTEMVLVHIYLRHPRWHRAHLSKMKFTDKRAKKQHNNKETTCSFFHLWQYTAQDSVDFISQPVGNEPISKTQLPIVVWMVKGIIYLKTWSPSWWHSLGRLWNLYQMEPCQRKYIIADRHGGFIGWPHLFLLLSAFCV